MKKSVIRKYRVLSIVAGVAMGCIFPVFTSLFMVPKSETSQLIFVVLCVLAGVIVGLLSYFIGNQTVVKTLLRFNKSFTRMSQGDFTHQCTIESKDSIGVLVDRLNEMRESLKQLLAVVINKSATIEDIVVKNNQELDQLHLQIGSVTDAAKEVSQDMENMTFVSSQLKVASEEIISATKSISEKAQAGLGEANTISQKALITKNEIGQSIENAENILGDTNQKLSLAIENVKVVEEINELLSGIMRISSQTNMLALNASIESNRAQIDGKGFLVIADEIQKLSNESKANTERITSVMGKVFVSVEDLVHCSQELLHFLSTDIRRDYSSFQQIVNDYDENANYTKAMVNDFHKKSEEVFGSVQMMSERIQQIDQLSDNSAEKVGSIFEEVSLVNEETAALLAQTKVLGESSEQLQMSTERFRLERK